ncbi:response regulator transcription factor [Bacillus fonticola]|uniref:response regulator transcription factor n=1 Tax=Bacillus fonticola TaxID=2728853 RepID=UPI001474629F|nr:response regulator transcription factor [Bacillus fonticola]
MGNETVLIVEDEIEIQNLLALYLERDFQVVTAKNGKEALTRVQQQVPDAILLDILLPEMNGLEVCRKIRETNEKVPILFLSCKRESEDKIHGLELGGDDYITKPFDPGEVLARVKAILRRVSRKPAIKTEQNDIRTFGSLEIDFTSYTVCVHGESVNLYAKEMQLLLHLAKRPNQVFSIEQLYNQIWGEDRFGDLKTVMVHISNLRKKIEQNPAKPEYILTVRGFGYKFNPSF